MPEAFGLELDPGAFSFLDFSATIPSVEASNYLVRCEDAKSVEARGGGAARGI
jgi:hypothetical protein